MTVATRPGYDCTHTYLAHLPHDGATRALYITGSPDIVATAADLAANPGCLRIDQSPVNTPLDELADYLDYENGAATLADLAPWTVAAWRNWHAGARPGQRTPAIYASRSNITAVVNQLVADGVKDNVGLIIADWTGDPVGAAREVAAGSGPFPVVGRQYSDQGGGGLYDLDVFSAPWVANTSRAPVIVHGVAGVETIVRFLDGTSKTLTWP